ncbi:hypothetical protein [Stenotrophomonas maltophilia]|uniref:hypothetical protein n=1 Tax=Stenotrophomonas maltophilia TaxID=40324 RepID=UPI00201D1B0A|nr:hypothetical protein [Stenotrophomonas maltophilia]UQY97302.1 hypothetical protein LZ605_08065 [Stenotrophomonas maltophilia]
MESTQTWKFIQTITPALIGFAGVCVGAGITALREYLVGKRKSKSDGAYLAAIVGGALDTLISGCSDVVGDSGQVDSEGYSHPRTEHPQFDPLKLDVEWRTIPPDLLFDIQDLPYQLLFAEGAIGAASEYAATPPDYEEFFEERQYQFARIGLHCIDIADRLRAHAKLTARSKAYQWDPKEYFQQKIDKIEAQRAKPNSFPDFAVAATEPTPGP